MWRLDVSSEAELEIFEAALRYERERAGLGFRFEAQVNTVFASLLDYPFQFPEIEEGARRALVRDFPYGVFFTAEDNLITVLAVLHLASAPRHLERPVVMPSEPRVRCSSRSRRLVSAPPWPLGQLCRTRRCISPDVS